MLYLMVPGGTGIMCMIYSRTCFLGRICTAQIVRNLDDLNHDLSDLSVMIYLIYLSDLDRRCPALSPRTVVPRPKLGCILMAFFLFAGEGVKAVI